MRWCVWLAHYEGTNHTHLTELLEEREAIYLSRSAVLVFVGSASGESLIKLNIDRRLPDGRGFFANCRRNLRNQRVRTTVYYIAMLFGLAAVVFGLLPLSRRAAG